MKNKTNFITLPNHRLQLTEVNLSWIVINFVNFRRATVVVIVWWLDLQLPV
jgi:hypothetical protein